MTPAQRAAVHHFTCRTCGAPAGTICHGIDITVSFIGSQPYAVTDDAHLLPIDVTPLMICDERLERLDELPAVDLLAAIEYEVEDEW